MTEETIENAWTKLYHPTGALITFPLFLNEPITLDTAKLVMQSVDNILAAGFQVNMPGLEEGELMEEVSHIARREGSDETAIIDFYSSNTKLVKKFMHVYLDTPDDIAAFESATGIKLGTINVYDGNQAIERTNPKASKYVVTLPRSLKVVYKINPKWEQWNQAGKEGKEPHKRLLVRCEVGRKPEAAVDSPEQLVVASEGATQYKKFSADLMGMLIQKTGLKPTIISPILAKLPGDTVSFESALNFVLSNVKKETE